MGALKNRLIDQDQGVAWKEKNHLSFSLTIELNKANEKIEELEKEILFYKNELELCKESK